MYYYIHFTGFAVSVFTNYMGSHCFSNWESCAWYRNSTFCRYRAGFQLSFKMLKMSINVVINVCHQANLVDFEVLKFVDQ